MKQFPDSVYLNQAMAKHYYCWSWTWYEIMTQIAGQQDSTYTLVLIDDWIIECSYREIREHINILRAECEILKMIQYGQSSQVPPGREEAPSVSRGDVVTALPCFRRGITESGDFANLLSPVGAREILFVANKWGGVPNWVFWHAARELNQAGYFSVAGRNLIFPSNSRFIFDFQDGRQR